MKELQEKSATPLRPGGEGSTAQVAAEVRRLGFGSELLGLETAKAEGVQAGKGAGVIEGLVAHRAPGQLVD